MIKKNLQYKINKIDSKNSDLVCLTLGNGSNILKVILIYRSPNSNIEIFLKELKQIIKKNECENIIILGDINIDILKGPNEKIAFDYLYLLNKFGYHSEINSTTRKNDSTATCIDHIFTKLSNISIENIEILDLGITDHMTISFQIKSDKTQFFKQSQQERFVQYTNYNKINDDLSEIHWHEKFKNKNSNESTLILTNIINDTLKQNTITILKNNLQKQKPQWLTNLTAILI